MARRWKRSRHSTVTHIPVYSSISDMLLIDPHYLLSGSLQYGIVARSVLTTGRVLRGYLSASGRTNGWGLGNPNAEFNPNVSACSISAGGGTARIAWGYHSGEVAVLTANKVMEARSHTTHLCKSTTVEQHMGPVLDVIWDETKQHIITAGADGRVKTWDAKSMRCLWSSEACLDLATPDACLKVASALGLGCVAVATRSGKVLLWTRIATDGHSELVPHPIAAAYTFIHSVESESLILHDVITLSIDSTCLTPAVLVAYRDDPCVYRLQPSVDGRTLQTTTFGEPSFGPLTSVAPFFTTTPGQSSILLTGNRIGGVSVYDWNGTIIEHPNQKGLIPPIRKFEAHKDGSSVTALAWNGIVLVTGSMRGTTHIWGGLTFTPLATLAAPKATHHRPHWLEHETAVKGIILDPKKDMIIVNVGDAVMMCAAGPMVTGKTKHHQADHGAGKRKNKATAKYLRKRMKSNL